MNALNVIAPYKWHGMWVFDDPDKELAKEPFVSGADTMIDLLVAAHEIPDADGGFRIIFSAGEFPGHDERLTWTRHGDGGDWYFAERTGIDAWLCPALLRYFDDAPPELFLRVDPAS